MNLDNTDKINHSDILSERVVDLRSMPVGSLVKLTYENETFPAILIDKDNPGAIELMPLLREKFLRAQTIIDKDRTNNSIADHLNIIREYTGNGMLKQYHLSKLEYNNWKKFIQRSTHGRLQKYLFTFLERAKALDDERVNKPSFPTKIFKLNNRQKQTDKVVLNQEEMCDLLLESLEENGLDEIRQDEEIVISSSNKVSKTKLNAHNLIKTDKEAKKANRIKQKNYINQIVKQIKNNEEESKTEAWRFFARKTEEDASLELKKKSVIKLPDEYNEEEDNWIEYKEPILNDSLKADIYIQAKEEAESDLEKENNQNYYFVNHAQEILSYFNTSKTIKIFFDEEYRSVEQSYQKLSSLNWQTQQHEINYAKKQINKLSWVRDFEKELKIIFDGKSLEDLSSKSTQVIASYLQPLMSGKYSSQEATEQWSIGKFKLFEKIQQLEYQEKKKKLLKDRDFEVRVIEQTAEINKELKILEYDRKLKDVQKEEPKKTSWWQKAVNGVKNIFKR